MEEIGYVLSVATVFLTAWWTDGWMRRSSSGYYPDGMDNPRDIAQQSKKYVEPEMPSQTDLQKYTQGRQQNGEYDAN